MKAFAFSLITVLLLTGCQQKEEEPVRVSAGHGIFLSNCAGCHQGTGYPPGANSVILNSSYIKSEAQFIQLLRNPTAPGMPPFPETQLSDAEAHELYIFIQTQLSNPSQ